MKVLPRTLKFCVVVLTFVRSSSADAKCVQSGPCNCSSSDGDIDLSDLDRPDKPLSWTGSISNFTYNPCTGFLCGLYTDTAVCETSSILKASVGNQKNAKFIYDEETRMNYIAYDVGNYASQVYLQCDPKESGRLISGPQEAAAAIVYRFTLSSRSCCPVSSGGGGGDVEPSGLSIGSVLLIIFFSLVFAYFVGGMLFMHFVRHESGVNLIPNVEFWSGLPALIRDGFVFTYSAIATLLIGRNRQGYARV